MPPAAAAGPSLSALDLQALASPPLLGVLDIPSSMFFSSSPFVFFCGLWLWFSGDTSHGPRCESRYFHRPLREVFGCLHTPLYDYHLPYLETTRTLLVDSSLWWVSGLSSLCKLVVIHYMDVSTPGAVESDIWRNLHPIQRYFFSYLMRACFLDNDQGEGGLYRQIPLRKKEGSTAEAHSLPLPLLACSLCTTALSI